MKSTALKAVLPSVTLLLATSCVDSNYDLSDVDTTLQIQVTELTLPINIDAITLSDIIALDEDDQVHEVTDLNGKSFYAFTESGDFKSDPIYIRGVTVAGPQLEPATLYIAPVATTNVSANAAISDVRFDITEINRTFAYSARNVDASIVDVTSVKSQPFGFTLTISIPSLSSVASKAVIEGLEIRLMKGLTATTDDGTYDARTGIWKMNTLNVSGTSVSAKITLSAFDLAAAGIRFDGKAHSLDIPGEFTIVSGTLVLTPKSSSSTPEQLTLTTRYDLQALDIKSVSGRVRYALDGMGVNPISLSNLPDFLDEYGTNIFLANPQLYLTVNNPIADYRLAYQTGLALTAKRPSLPNVPDFTYATAEPVSVGYDKGVDGPYHFVLAPHTSTADLNILDSSYQENLTGIAFPGLSNILAVPTTYEEARLPETIEIELTDPQIVESDVVDFELGQSIAGIKGSYTFVAPLALGDGSTIVYSGTEGGWNDEDVDAITITSVTITADVTNSTPLATEIKAYPLDKEGNRIGGVTITGTTVAAGAVDAPVTITMTGTITHLDGINYVAVLKAGSEEALNPQQTLSLKNIKAKISGSYTKEL